jgi:hypothetical protein
MRTAGAVAPNMILTTLMRVVNSIRKLALRVATPVFRPMTAPQDPADGEFPLVVGETTHA